MRVFCRQGGFKVKLAVLTFETMGQKLQVSENPSIATDRIRSESDSSSLLRPRGYLGRARTLARVLSSRVSLAPAVEGRAHEHREHTADRMSAATTRRGMATKLSAPSPRSRLFEVDEPPSRSPSPPASRRSPDKSPDKTIATASEMLRQRLSSSLLGPPKARGHVLNPNASESAVALKARKELERMLEEQRALD